MCADFGFQTTEAGAGSYPAPPDIQEAKVCVRCGETRGLKTINGETLCEYCAAVDVFENSTHEDRMRYIRDNFQDQTEFFIHWFFDSLHEYEQLHIIRPYFYKSVSQEEQEWQSKTYISNFKMEFAEFMEKVASHGT